MRGLNIGEFTRQSDRCRDALLSQFAKVPDMNGLRKDHKSPINDDPDLGPPLRPLVNAKNAPNAPLSSLMSTITQGLRNQLNLKIQTELLNGESLLSDIDGYNTDPDLFNIIPPVQHDLRPRLYPNPNPRISNPIQDNVRIIGSMDACALFPSVKRHMAMEAVVKSAMELNFCYEGAKVELFSKLAALLCTREELKKLNLDQVVPTAVSTTTVNSFTKSPKDSQFDPAPHSPNARQSNTIVSLALSKTVNACMYYHYYKLGNTIKRQSDGGAIGVDLTNEVSCLFMLRWDRRFKSKLKKLGIVTIIYRRYVDDITVVMSRIMPGWKYNAKSDKMEFHSDQVQSDSEIPDDRRTMEILCQVANSISELRFTYDCPSLNPSGTVPILDMQFWIGDNNEILYKFYKKKCSSPYVVLKRSAIPDSTKRTTLFQEAIRRLSNTSPNLQPGVRNEILSEFMNMLRVSGYSERFRSDLLNGVLKRWEQVMSEVKNGTRMLHRSQELIRSKKLLKSGRTASTWFLKNETTATVSVPITPSSNLKSTLQNVLNKIRGPDGGRTKVLEESGIVISRMAPPTQPLGCQYKTKCLANDDTNCQTAGVIYRAKCTECPDTVPNVYIGTSGQSVHARSLSHAQSVKYKAQNNSLYKHNLTNHPETHLKYDRFKFERVSTHQNLMERLLTEAYSISNNKDPLMNSKTEYGAAKWVSMESKRTYT